MGLAVVLSYYFRLVLEIIDVNNRIDAQCARGKFVSKYSANVRQKQSAALALNQQFFFLKKGILRLKLTVKSAVCGETNNS